MLIAALLEPNHETRVAITPQTAKNYIKLGFAVSIEKNAGAAAGFRDQEYEQIGVQICKSKKNIMINFNIISIIF